MDTFDCSGEIVFTNSSGSSFISCVNGNWSVVEQPDIEIVFNEYLSPDAEVISLIMGMSLVFWVVGHSLGRVVAVMRKVS